MTRGVLIVVATVLLAPVPAAEGRPRRAPVRFPQDNIPDRKPLPGSEPDDRATRDRNKVENKEKKKDEGPGVWETVKGVAVESIGVVEDWQQELAKHMPTEAAWAVVGAPAYLLLVLLLLVRRRRRRPPAMRHHLQRTATPEPSRTRKKTAARATAPSQPARKPRTVEEIALLEHSPAEKLMLASNDQSTSWHEAFVVMGADEQSIRALRRAVQTALDEVTWSAAVSSQNPRLLDPAWERWIKGVAAERVKAWLQENPLVQKTSLQVSMPDLHEVSELGSVMLTQADGLGADLNDAQEDLLQQARWALQQVWHEASPHALMLVARRTKVSALLDDKMKAYPLALLIHGVRAFENSTSAQANPVDLGQEFRAALEDHRQLVDTPVGGEGCAVHALDVIGGGGWPGVGTIAASMAGAAFSAMAVTVKISKLVGDLDASQKEVCERLGALVNAALQNRKSGDGAAIVGNIQRALGQEAAEATLKRADELVASTKRLGKQPLWPDAPSATSPDLVLVNLHRGLVQHAIKQSGAAEQRLNEIFEKLAFEGKTGDNRALAMRRLGYCVACFGMALLRSTGTDLLSAGREAISSMTRG